MNEHIAGLEDAKRAIEELTRDMRRKVVPAALKDAAKPMIAAAKANAPVKTGLIKKRISVYTSKIKRGKRGEIGVYIKPKATAKARKAKTGDPYYYKFQEAGFHAVGRRKATGDRGNRAKHKTTGVRFITGKAFIGRAFQSHSGESASIFSEAIKRRIEQANRRK